MKFMLFNLGEYCKMGDKDGKQVLVCSWGKKVDPVLGMDYTAALEKIHEEDKTNVVIISFFV